MFNNQLNRDFGAQRSAGGDASYLGLRAVRNCEDVVLQKRHEDAFGLQKEKILADAHARSQCEWEVGCRPGSGTGRVR